MARPNFTASLIGDLRKRVIDHNTRPGAEPVKLGKLRDLYTKGFRGADPSANAMAKVEQYLAKAAGDFDDAEHPRANDGKFASKGAAAPRAPRTAALPLPQTRADHENLAATNAGYAALQSTAIPETRFESAGGVLRDAGSAIAGLTLAASLARGKSNGIAARAMRFGGAAAGRLAGEGAAALLTGVTEGGRDLLRRLPRMAEAPEARAARWIAARGRAKAISKGAEAAGRGIGDRGFKGASAVMRAGVNAAALGADSRAAANVRRAAAVGVAATPIALGIDNTVQGTPADPQQLGALIDSSTYRTVLKYVTDNDEIGAARDVLSDMLRKGADAGELQKAVPHLAGLYTTAGRAVLTGLVGTAGALAGAAVGHGAEATIRHIAGKRGNPYHDKHGRFTNSTDANGVGLASGALIGGALAGMSLYAGLRSHNVELLRASARAARAAYSRRLAAVARPKGVGEAADLLARRADLIDEAVAKHPAVKAAKDSVSRLGASSDLHYKSTIVRQANEKIANNAAFLDDFEIPVTARGKTAWTKIGEIKSGLPSSRRDAIVADRIQQFVEDASPADFERAIKNVQSAESRKTLLHFFDRDNRATWAAGVDQQIAAHHLKIADAETKATAAGEALQQAQVAHLDSKALVDRGGDDAAVNAAESAYKRTGNEVAKATKAHEKALADHDKLKSAGATIVSPVNGKPIPVPTQMDLNGAVNEVEDRVHAVEAAKLDKRIAAIRAVQRERVGERANRVLGALAAVGDAHGLPAHARMRGAVVARLHREIRGLEGQLADATRVRDAAQASLRGLGSKASKAERDALRQRVKDGTGKIDEIAGTLAMKRAQRAPLAANFERHLMDRAKGRSLRLLPDGLRNDIVADLRRAGDTMKGSAKDFFQRPTMQTLLRFARKRAGQGVGIGKDIAHELFFTRQPDGSFKPSWVKASVNTGLVAGATQGAKEVYDYARDSLSGDAATRAQAKFPHHLIEREINPLTGAAYAALVVPHPKEKGEKVVLYGERQDSFDGHSKRIYAGGRISTVKEQFKNGGWNRQNSDAGEATGKVHTGDAHGLAPEAAKSINDSLHKLRGAGAIEYADTVPNGPRAAYRKATDQDGNSAASAFMEHMKRHYLNKGDLSQQGYWHGLAALSSKQGAILTPKQSYEILTNRNIQGGDGRYTNGIFNKVPGFSSTDPGTVASALRVEVDRALKLNPTGEQKAALQRAVQLVGIAKGIDKKELSAIHGRFGTASAPQPAANVPQGPKSATGSDRPLALPVEWSKDEVTNVARGEARALAQQLRMGHAGAVDDLANTIDIMARKVHQTHGLDMGDSIKAASAAIWSAAGNTTESRKATADDLRSGFWENNEGLFDRLDEQARKRKSANMNKLAPLDDLDQLAKAFGAFDGSKHPRVSQGQHGGGEFAPENGGSAASGSASPDTGASAGGTGGSSRSMSAFHPVRAVPDLASNLGLMGAWAAANKYIPGRAAGRAWASNALGSAAVDGADSAVWSLAQKFLPAPVGIAAGALKIGASLIASGAASAGAEAAANAGVRGAYALAGSKAPTYTQPTPSLGRALTEFGGQTVGTLVGGAFGSGVGSIATGAAGAWAGGIAGDKIYDWFNGYGNQRTQRVMSRYMAPAQA